MTAIGSASQRPEYHRLYHSAAWLALRLQFLEAHPLCAMCKAQGKIVGAQVVDHVKPHRGDEALFFDSANLQSLCAAHHNSAKQTLEKSGYLRGCDERGYPLDRDHFWHKK